MYDSRTKPSLRWLTRLQAAAVLLMLLAIAGHKFSLLAFQLSFYTFGAALAAVVLLGVLALMSLPWLWWRKRSLAPVGWAVLVALLPVGAMLLMVGDGFRAPVIHDISTDMTDPPAFEAAAAERGEGENSVHYAGEAVARLQRQAYPDVRALVLQAPLADVLTQAEALCREQGWRVLAVEPARGRIEAVAETTFFGFRDDVVIRVSETGDGTQVDMRSASRVGKSDLGANAKRIHQYLQALAQRF